MQVGDKFKLTTDAEENYEELLKKLFGSKWARREFEVTHTARNIKEHPGYDEGVSPQKLYDFKDIKTGKDMPISVYDWEVW